MSAAIASPRPTVVGRRPLKLRRVGILLLGVIILPLLINAILNSYGALTVESAVRMAFGAVAGQTIAILSGVATVVLTLMHRPKILEVAAVLVIAVAVAVSAIGIISSASEVLLTNLELVAEINLQNQ